MKSTLKTLEAGAKFGTWTLLGTGERRGHSYFWKCVCACGQAQLVNGYSLRTGTSLRCVSCRVKVLHSKESRAKKKASMARKWANGKAALNEIFSGYRRNARIKGREFSLSFEVFKSLIDQNCHYCNTAPRTEAKTIGHGSYFYNGIDRKDNALGYIPSNSLPCCSICNKAKSTMPYSEFISWIHRTSQYLKESNG